MVRSIDTKPPWGGLHLDPAQAFVLTLARAFALGQPAAIILESLSPIASRVASWQRVDILLRAHRCTAVAYAVLRDPVIKSAEIVPESFLMRKRDWYGSAFTRSVMEPLVLHRVLDAFSNAEIPTLAIKGLAVGTWLYGDVALREHDDIDLLVPADDGTRANDVLMSLGYLGGYRPPLYPGESPATASYQDSSGGIPIDLSFDPLHIFGQSPLERRSSFDGWWVRHQELKIGNRAIPSPGAEDQLLQLTRHLQFHGYFRVNWWVDVLLLLRRYGEQLDWELIGGEADRHSITGGLHRTLEIAGSFYGLEVPRAAWWHLHPHRVTRSLHRRVWPDRLSVPRERPLRDQEGTPIAPRFLSPGGVHPIAGLVLFLINRQRTKYVRYLIQRVIPPKSWLTTRYGVGSYPSLLRAHWRGLRDLRARVRRNMQL